VDSSKNRESRARLAIAIGLLLTFGGLAIVSTGSKQLGGPIVAVGWAALLYGIHAFGRLGRS
jgi:hypothetical protein